MTNPYESPTHCEAGEEKNVNVFPIGSKAMLQGAIEVTITAISIRGGAYIQYEVSWVDGMSHSCKYVDACEITSQAKKMAVGFTAKELP